MTSKPTPLTMPWPLARDPRAPALFPIPAAARREVCTGTHPTTGRPCGAFLWPTPHPQTGHVQPLTCAPVVRLADGSEVTTGADAPHREVDATGARDVGGLGYSHFVDCPAAGSFRRGRP